MSAIIFYQCSNKECSLDVMLSSNIPIWSDKAPMEIRKVPVGIHYKKYVIGHTSQKLCLSCHEIVKIPQVEKQKNLLLGWFSRSIKEGEKLQEGECPNCHTFDQYLEEGKPCPGCKSEVVQTNKDLYMRF